ncbi:MAG TPA: tetratricopeptide repeat protein [Bryobacteraceae bacterium]|nr:tetratricopeptide repeat protein [Bryobacteraceae bacterium]
MKYVAASALVGAFLLSSACTQSPQKLVEAGNRYHDSKKYKEASILYQKALTKDKTYAEAYYREGLNLLDSGNPTGAANFLRRAIDLQPANTDADAKLAEIYLVAYAGNPTRFKQLLPEIKDLVAKIDKYQPNSFTGFRLQGLLDLAQNDSQGALESFAKANQLKPYSPDVVTWYAETLYNAKRVDEAETLERNMLAHDKKWGPGYDFLFLLYSRAGNKDKAKAILEERVQNDPASALAIQNLANYQAVSGDYADAETTAKRVLADPKAFPNRYQLLGDFYFRNKKFDQAMQQYQTGVNDDSKNALLYKERMVAVYQATNRRQDALNLARGIAKDNPKNLEANEAYAALLLQNGSRDSVSSSLSELKDLAKNNPTDPLLHLYLARAYYSTDKDKSLSEAQEAMQDEVKQAQAAVPVRSPRPQLITGARIVIGGIYEDRAQHAKAMEQANLVLQADPKNAEAQLIKAKAQVGLGQSDQALPDLVALVQQNPAMAGAQLELANLYLARREFDKATAQYQQFSKQYPSDLRGPVGLQNVKLAEGKGDEAISGVQALVDQNPNNLQLRYQLANMQAAAGIQVAAKNPDHAKQLYEAAANNYKEFLKTTANSSDVWLRLGVLQRELKQYDAALASFEQASNADPHSAAPVLNSAMLLEFLGKKKEALAAYNRVIGIDPENPLAMNNLAFISAEEGVNLDQAMTFAEKAKQRFPNSPDVSDTLGYVYYQKHLNAQALQIFKDLVAAHQDNPTFRLHLAMALEKSGDKGAARDQARKALQFATQPEQQNEIKSFLGQIG